MFETGVLAKLLDCMEPAVDGWMSAADAGDFVTKAREDIRTVRVDGAVEREPVGVEPDGVGGVVETLSDNDGGAGMGEVLVFANYDLSFSVGCRFAVYDFVCASRVRMLLTDKMLR